MGRKTKIQYSDHTFSPWRGCAHVHEGCANCYAESFARRCPRLFGTWGPHGVRVLASERQWKEVLGWNRAANRAGVRRRVLTSMCDIFEWRSDLFRLRDRFFALLLQTPHLDWLVATKRPAMAGRWFAGTRWTAPNNLWLGYSASTQASLDSGLPHLLAAPVAHRWLSLEPLLGPLTLPLWRCDSCGKAQQDALYCCQCGRQTTNSPAVSWVIVGGESGLDARPCRLEWLRSVVRHCRSAGVPCYVKQLGSNPYLDDPEIGQPVYIGPGSGGISHRNGGDPAEWPADLQVRELP